MNELLTEAYFCPDCDTEPPGFDSFEPPWKFCPIHGTPLVSDAELHEADAQARADALGDERFMRNVAHTACGIRPRPAA